MSLSNLIITLTIIITVVPVLKIAREKRFSLYNVSIVLMGIAILIFSFLKNNTDERTQSENERVNRANEKNIKKLISDSERSRGDLIKIMKSLDTMGLAVNPHTGKVTIEDQQKFKNIILSGNSSNNVTSIDQKGGQTAKEITNNNN
jgi:hypothetical protein